MYGVPTFDKLGLTFDSMSLYSVSQICLHLMLEGVLELVSDPLEVQVLDS